MSGEKSNLNSDVLSCTELHNFPRVYKMAERLVLLVQRMAAEIKRGDEWGKTSARNQPGSKN